MVNKDQFYKQLGQTIKDLRERVGISQLVLAKEIGVNANDVSRWESAVYRPSVFDIYILKEALKRLANQKIEELDYVLLKLS